MRIAIVFSSPTPDIGEYMNIWSNCPAKYDIDRDKLVIGGKDWRIFAFDGRSDRFYCGTWNLEVLQNEILGIMEEHTSSSLSILLHGSKKELGMLMEQFQIADIQEIFPIWYSSSKGTFFNKCIKPFANEGSDAVFEAFWNQLEMTSEANNDNLNLKDQIIFISHRLAGINRWMRMVVEDATEDIVFLKDFKKFDFEFLLNEYEKVEPTDMKLDVTGIKKVRTMMKDTFSFVKQFLKFSKYCNGNQT